MSERTILLVVVAVSAVVAAVIVAARPSASPVVEPPIGSGSATDAGMGAPTVLPTGSVVASAYSSAIASANSAFPVDAAPPRALVATEPVRAAPSADCPRDMALVEGWWCPFVAHRCEQKRAGAGSKVCDKFRSEVLCEGALEWMRFCVDTHEYPNVPGMLPAVLASFEEASSACETESKRLCDVREWTFACEGQQMLPYPTGVGRDRQLCHWDAGAESPVVPSQGPRVGAELERLDRRAPTGEHARCRSPFGVVDMAGNVAEWARDPNGGKASPPFVSVVVGGAWGGSESTCRAEYDPVPPTHRSSALGFRCCVDAAPRSAPIPEPWERRGGFRPLRTANDANVPALP